MHVDWQRSWPSQVGEALEALLTEREAILRQAADTLKEPLFLKDADRLARLRQHAGSDSGSALEAADEATLDAGPVDQRT